jgi:hypothetical protein
MLRWYKPAAWALPAAGRAELADGEEAALMSSSGAVTLGDIVDRFTMLEVGRVG